MGDQNRGSTPLKGPTYKPIDEIDRVLIQSRMWLIKKEQVRLGHEHPGELCSALHPVAAVIGTPVCRTPESNQLKGRECVRSFKTSGVCNKIKVLSEREFGVQAGGMSDVSDTVSHVIFRWRCEICSENGTLPVRWGLQCCNQP